MHISWIGIAARRVINVVMKSHTNTSYTMSCMQHALQSKLIMHIKQQMSEPLSLANMRSGY